MNRQDYLKLLKEIKRHNDLYFRQSFPEISDYDYDLLVKEVERIEIEHPEWVPDDTPTHHVDEMPTKGVKHIKHTYPMLSLSNTYSREEVDDFIKRVEKGLDNQNTEYCVELKVDGVALSIKYEKGKLVCGVTRGNGWYGDEVTANIETIKNIPHVLKVPIDVEVRGEVFIPKKEFLDLNCEREEAGEEVWANPRNAAAGSLKLLDHTLVAKRKLHFMAYGIMGKNVKKQSEIGEYLQRLDFPVYDLDYFQVCKNIDEIFVFIDHIEHLRSILPFDIDGVVIKVNNLRDQDLLGATAKSPRWATAYKFAPAQAESVIEDIIVQVGRTGVLTPVAKLKPTLLSGSAISRATLHNEQEIIRKDIRIGDVVVIEKGGDVIPKVIRSIKERRTSTLHPWKMPNVCPMCGKKVVYKKGEIAVRCPNHTQCGGQKLQRLIFFASKNAMDIENLGPEIVKKLVENRYVSSFSDIYLLRKEDIKQIEGFKEKSVYNLLISIEKSKQTTFSRFILAIGIPYVGRGTAELLEKFVGSIEKLSQMSEEALCMIDGIGTKMAHSIAEFFLNPANQKEIEKLITFGVQPKAQIHTTLSHSFFGKVFVLTGSLKMLKRSEAIHLIKERGGKVHGSISKKTDYLLLGEHPGSKYRKALNLGIEMMDEKTFHKKL